MWADTLGRHIWSCVQRDERLHTTFDETGNQINRARERVSKCHFEGRGKSLLPDYAASPESPSEFG